MVTVGKSFLPLLIIIAQLVLVAEGFAPISLHYYRHHLLPLRKLHNKQALQQQSGVSSSSSFSSSSFSSRLPTLSSISLFAVNNDDDDDDDKDRKYLKDNNIYYGSVEYVRYIHDNEAALLDYKAIMEWYDDLEESDRDAYARLERAKAYLELLRDGKIRPATKRLQSSPVEDAMDCLSCLD